MGNFLPELIVRNNFSVVFLPLETAEVDKEDHKEHLPKLKLPKIIVSAAQIGNELPKMIPK